MFRLSACILAILLCLAYAKKQAGSKVDTSDVVNPDPEAVDTETAEYGKFLEGDIKTEGNSQDRNAANDESWLWEDARVPYIFGKDITNRAKRKIKTAIADFNKFTCVRFVPRRKNDKDYVKFQADADGCYALLGKMGSQQPINLDSYGCMYKGTIIHEMLHTIGFSHEQARSDRDRYITVHFNNIQKEFHDQFEKLQPRDENQQGMGYDFASVMHYESTAFTKNGRRTITTKNKRDQNKIGQRAGFSKQDIEEVNKLYKCSVKTGGSASGGGSITRRTPRPRVTPRPTGGGAGCTDKSGSGYCVRELKRYANYCRHRSFLSGCQKTCKDC